MKMDTVRHLMAMVLCGVLTTGVATTLTGCGGGENADGDSASDNGSASATNGGDAAEVPSGARSVMEGLATDLANQDLESALEKISPDSAGYEVVAHWLEILSEDVPAAMRGFTETQLAQSTQPFSQAEIEAESVEDNMVLFRVVFPDGTRDDMTVRVTRADDGSWVVQAPERLVLPISEVAGE